MTRPIYNGEVCRAVDHRFTIDGELLAIGSLTGRQSHDDHRCYIYELLNAHLQYRLPGCHPRNRRREKDHADAKKVRKKGKAKVAGGSVGMGRHEPSSDSWDPELDIDRAMQIKVKPLQFQTQPHPAGILGSPSQRQRDHLMP